MISHNDLLMYLVAVKSLFSSIRRGQAIILDDGTLTSKDRALIEMHLSPSQVVTISDVRCGSCPKGGTWERLLLISEYIEDNYLIQMDSDTLTLGNIPEVMDCIRENRSFTLGTGMGRQILPMKDICKQMKTFESDYVQVVAEQNFDKLQYCSQLKYIRGCSGFAGFAKGSFSRSQVEEFSQEMERIVRERWFHWGSEQVTSNFVIANSPQSCVLPYPKYTNFAPEIPYEQSSFLHFIGTYRFKKGVYVRKARAVVDKLQTVTAEHTNLEP